MKMNPKFNLAYFEPILDLARIYGVGDDEKREALFAELSKSERRKILILRRIHHVEAADE